jgi:hypothetical protein
MSAILYIGGEMAKEEKNAWIMLCVTVAAYATYITVLLGRVGNGRLAQTPYSRLMLFTILGAIVASIVINILVSIVTDRGDSRKDQRDREIYRSAEYIGQAFIVMGGVAALIMAMRRYDYFWIANVLYLGFVLSAVLSSITKVVMYRRGLPSW